MTSGHAAPSLIGGVGLLERGINYARGSLNLVRADAMSRRSPCRDWDLRALLRHMNDSLAALQEAVDLGRVGLETPMGLETPSRNGDPVAMLRDRACRLLGACASPGGGDVISIAGSPLTTGIVTSTGALEVAVHGWDVAVACGHDRPIPPPLAEELLRLAPLFVSDADRPGRFAAAVDVSPLAEPGERLLAFLGRRPPGHRNPMRS